MISETDRIELTKALALKKHLAKRMALPRQYEEKIRTVAKHGKLVYDKYQNGKALIEKAGDWLELFKAIV